MKKCFRCGQEKELAEFYRHPQMADGYLGKCKECTKCDVRENYEKRREYYLEYDRRRYKENPGRREGIKGSQKCHPKHEWARKTLRNAIARGKMHKKPCEVCGESKVDAHHSDYSKPLQVHWLCRKHHMEYHRTPHGCTGTAEFYPTTRRRYLQGAK